MVNEWLSRLRSRALFTPWSKARRSRVDCPSIGNPDLILVASRSTLTEVSLTSVPADPFACVIAGGEDAFFR
jgi:hypothetical protein